MHRSKMALYPSHEALHRRNGTPHRRKGGGNDG